MAEHTSEKTARFVFLLLTLSTAFVAFYFIGYIFYTAYPIFVNQGLVNFITGTKWSYSQGIYGIRIFIIGTLIITALSLIISLPVSIFTAIFLSEYASPKIASLVRPFVELLVGIPSVVYGILGLYVFGNILRDYIIPFFSSNFGYIFLFRSLSDGSGIGVLLASIVLAIMIMPTITTISEDSIRSVAREHREASYSLGATQWETIRYVVLPAAFNGITAAIVLGIMRAMGETMAVVMLLGNTPIIPGSLFDTGYAMTSKILNDIGNYVSMDEPKSALFGIAAVLFAIEIVFVGISRKLGGKL
ncbi:phosphate ABC transporter membrane protein 1, PhoT family [Methanolobus vulcani]|uniref:Phosphate transport system permease protein n=1 Tax=Methanolobus vulcani TaxID=38026 RepID=A0A7Z7FEJ8_9EURY|nr:phosphate ABC transporter permease subunit PstC [Methanolobus vulcani]SDF94412.1 phosphate ABC transporter membrane protein 1, PhoT family [Methanolobus vulcani]